MREPELRGGAEKDVLLRPHRGCLHRQRVLDPLVVRHELAIAEREDVAAVVRIRVRARVVGECTGHRARRIPEVVNGGAADAGGLPEEAALREITGPRRLRAVAGAEAEDAGCRVVRLVLVVRPLAFAVRERRSGFEQQHVEPPSGELLRDDRPSAPRADNDDVVYGH